MAATYCSPAPVRLLTITREPSQPEPALALSANVRLRIKAEYYEYRIYDLEMEFLLAPADSPEAVAAWDACEQVKASYRRTYPGRPLNPKRNPAYPPVGPAFGKIPPPEKKPRKPYTRKNAAA